MGREEIRNKIIGILSYQLCVKEAEIKEDSDIVDGLGADSLDCVEIIMEIEEEYQIEVLDDEMTKIKTVKNLIDCVEGKIEE